MASISFNITGSDGELSTNVSAGSQLTMSIDNPTEGASYFVLETVRNQDGFYDSSSPKNMSGSFELKSGIIGLVKDDYKMGAVIEKGSSELVFTPAINIVGSTVKVRGISGIQSAGESFTGLLDTYSGAAVAYSLRKLSSTYTGSAIRVRRASDNTEQNIGFDALGNLDTTALNTFCSGTDGFVTTWYDQSGNSNDATQSTAANQPKIYDSISGVIEENGKTSVEFDGSGDYFQLTSAIDNSGTETLFIICNSALSLANRGILRFNTNTYYRISDAQNAVDYSYGFPNLIFNFSLLSAQKLISAISVSYVKSVYRNSIASINNPITDTNLGTSINRISSSSLSYQGNMQEIIIYPSDKSSNRSGIETNINDFYSIY